jgi:hypothetical protein
MVMNNDDTFIREVNEELRSEQLQSAWRRFRPMIIGVATLIVVGVAGASVYEWWQTRESAASGDRFLAAVKDASDKKTDAALKEFDALTKDGFGSYPVLASMRIAMVKAETGDTKAAIADFLAIGKDGNVPPALRNVAKLRAGWLMVDTSGYDEVASQIEELTSEASQVRYSALEILGLSAYKAGDFAKSKEWLQKLVDDIKAPQGGRERARMILAMITSSGKLT